MPPIKNRRTRLTLKQKYELIKDCESLTIAGIVKKYEICASAVYKILKNKNEIEKEFREAENLNAKRYVTFRNEQLNTLVYEWFVKARAKNIPVTGTLLQEKAREIAKLPSVNATDFKASNGLNHLKNVTK